jgi:hypothetical protein
MGVYFWPVTILVTLFAVITFALTYDARSKLKEAEEAVAEEEEG